MIFLAGNDRVISQTKDKNEINYESTAPGCCAKIIVFLMQHMPRSHDYILGENILVSEVCYVLPDKNVIKFCVETRLPKFCSFLSVSTNLTIEILRKIW